MNRSLLCRALCAVGLALCAPASFAQAPLGYIITTVVGTGTGGFTGDGGAATDAQINNPSAIAFDASGNLYIADQLNSRIRKVTGATISTVAGKGDKGYFGDSGPAINAGLSFVQGIALDPQGNLYIADSPNHGIRKVTAAGVISTVAGGSYAGFDGDGGVATNAHINFPAGIAVDAASNFYFSDSGNQRVRKVTGTTLSTIAGNGVSGLAGDGGPATAANLSNPNGLAVDAGGNVYVADTDNGMIRKIALDGTITTIAGTGRNGFSGDGGPATRAMLNRPRGVAVDAAGVVYIADTLNSRIRAVSLNGTISTIAGNSYIGFSGDYGPATAAILKFPDAVAVGSAGRIYLADTQNNLVRVLTPIVAPAPPGPPVISSGGVVTPVAYGAAAAAAPGSWIEIYGANLSGSVRQWTAAEFNGVHAPTVLDGVRVTVGGKPAFVSFISPGQVNAQVPSDVGTGPQQVIVTTAVGASPPVNITINAAQPGLLAPSAFKVGSRQYTVALLADGRTYALPPGVVSGVPARPARPGETVVLYGVGFGAVDPAVAAGDVAASTASITAPLQVLFGQSSAAISYAGLVPGAVGLYQFNIQVPQVADNDAVPVTINLGGVTSSQSLFIAVRR